MSDMAIWPLKVAHVLLAFTYFSAGTSKLIHSGLRWLNGYTLQGHTFGDALERGHPLGIWLAQQHDLAVALSVFTILLEVFFFVSLFLPRLAPLFFLAALSFQIGLYLTGGYDFFQHMVLLTLLLFFLHPGWWRNRLGHRLDAGGAGAATGGRRQLNHSARFTTRRWAAGIFSGIPRWPPRPWHCARPSPPAGRSPRPAPGPSPWPRAPRWIRTKHG